MNVRLLIKHTTDIVGDRLLKHNDIPILTEKEISLLQDAERVKRLFQIFPMFLNNNENKFPNENKFLLDNLIVENSEYVKKISFNSVPLTL